MVLNGLYCADVPLSNYSLTLLKCMSVRLYVALLCRTTEFVIKLYLGFLVEGLGRNSDWATLSGR